MSLETFALADPTQEIMSASNGTEDCYDNVTSCEILVTRKTAPYDKNLVKVLEMYFLSISFVAAVVGNLAVILVLLLRSKKLSRMNFFILHLSIADIVVAFFNILSQLIQNVNDEDGIVRLHDQHGIQCRIFAFSQLMPLFASTYMLVSVAVDRYIAICQPMTTYSWSNKRSHMMVLATWSVAFIGASPQLGIFYYHNDKKRCYDIFFQYPEAFKYYTVYLLFCLLLVPVVVLVTLYSVMSYVVWSTVSQRERPSTKTGKSAHLVPRSHSRRGYSRAKQKTVMMTSVIVVLFILCWTPYWVAALIWAFSPHSFRNVVNLTFVLLSALNSCFNPFVYLLFNMNAVTKLLPCFREDRRRRRESTTGTMSMRVSTVRPSNGIQMNAIDGVDDETKGIL